MTRDPLPRRRAALRLLLVVAYAAAGVLHLVRPAPFVAITPGWVPAPAMVIAVTGVCELLGAAGLLIPRLRRFAGAMLLLYALCVFPANIHHAVDNVAVGGRTLSWRYHGPRLLFEPVIWWWTLFASRWTDWPWRRRLPSRPR